MLRASLRGLFARKLRLILAVVAIMLGTGFLSGAFVLTDSLGARFEKLFETINQNVDVQISLTADARDDDPRPRLTQAQLDAIAEQPGVAAVSGDVSQQNGVIPFDVADGKPVTTSGSPQIGAGVAGDDPFWLISLTEGRWPQSPDEAALSLYTAEQTHAKIGDRIKVFIPLINEPREFTVVGLAGYSGGRGSLGGETLVLLQLARAQELFFGETGVYSGAYLGAKPGVSQSALRDQVAPLVPTGFEAKTGEQANEDQANEVNAALSQVTNYILVPFAIVAVIVGVFLIFNTFNIVVAQRARELALMRALGASWGQVVSSVLVEALLVGALGSTFGLLMGAAVGYAGSAALTSLANAELPGGGVTIGVFPVLLAYIVGILVTIVSALIPAIKASMIPPLAAMREVSRPDKPLRNLSIVGGVLALPGAALMSLGLIGMGDTTLNLVLILLGVALLLLGVALLSPLLTRPLAGLIGRAVRWGVSGDLGVRNALRNPRRTAVTAAALMIGVTLVSAASVVANSFKVTMDETIRASVGAEVIISTSSSQGPPTGETGFPASTMDKVRTLPGVERTATFFLTMDATIEGKKNQSLFLFTIDDLPAAKDIFAIETDAGQVRTLDDDEFIADENTAKARGWKIGEQVPIALTNGGVREYSLIGTVASSPLWTNMILLPTSALDNFAGQMAYQAYVDLADGADTNAVITATEDIMLDYPMVTVSDRSSLLDQFNDIINIALVIVGVLLGLAIMIALLGILNTLLLSIYERTRELGVLRAVGLSRTGVTRMVGTESVVMAVFGCLLGVVLGSTLGAALSAALIQRDFLTTIAVPWLYLVGFMLIAAGSGVVAALWPAWRAARLNVLAAIAYE